ncbi:Uncharacterised protein [Kluyvera cryocrescens]|uniref:Glutathione import ATP-binding protein GsiA n=1 Tax=Kluyvera cryocrescens TaxID=580 RepID=A0A485C8C6_KLUCR|nr:Uncharacterised protein [Kluyvera cryocrescens]
MSRPQRWTFRFVCRWLGLLDELVKSRGLGLIFISHDINLVRPASAIAWLVDVRRASGGVHRACDLDHAQHPVYARG